MNGTVYVFANPEAGRVKVGVSCGLGDRLLALNDLWTGRTVTCQVCGGRLGNIGRPIRRHKAGGRQCPGGHALPMERDVTLAEKHLETMKAKLSEVSGTPRGSLTRRINKLAARIERFRDYVWPVGIWHSHTEFRADRVEAVEKRAHKILAEHLDETAPLGEIFSCSPEEAAKAVESALFELGLLESARREDMPKPPEPSGSAWDLGTAHPLLRSSHGPSSSGMPRQRGVPHNLLATSPLAERGSRRGLAMPAPSPYPQSRICAVTPNIRVTRLRRVTR